MDLTFVALEVVGRMKLDPDAFESELLPPAFDNDDILLVVLLLSRFVISLVLATAAGVGVDETRVLNGGDNMGGFFVTLWPTLEPLDELRLAGARATGARVDDNCETVVDGRLGTDVEIVGADFGGGIALTVLTDAALLMDERELLRLVFELLRSTSSRRESPLNVVFKLLDGTSAVLSRSDAILFGVEFKLRDAVNADELLVLSDRLRSSDC